MSVLESSVEAMPFAADELDDPIRQIRVTEAAIPANYFRWKHITWRLVAGLMMIPALPMIAVLVAMVRMTSEGPGIFTQVRVGRNGKLFKMYKIRTMRQDAEAKSGPVWSAPHDARVTTVGRFIRERHLDELPQLWNVIKGDMDLFGPRPERPEFTENLARSIPLYKERLQVLPGVTGLAQINLPPDQNLDDVRRKLELDLEYIREAHFSLDARMFLATALRLCGIPGEAVMCWAGVRRDVDLPELDSSTLEPAIAVRANPHCNQKQGRTVTLSVHDAYLVRAK